jgi:hypothetical protein
MLGWWIVIAQLAPDEWAATTDRKAALLANWETSLDGIDWIEKLTEEGKATRLLSGGYPNRYIATAGDVLPLIASGLPARTWPIGVGVNRVMAGGWTSNVEINLNKISTCPTDQILTIEVWDQS